MESGGEPTASTAAADSIQSKPKEKEEENVTGSLNVTARESVALTTLSLEESLVMSESIVSRTNTDEFREEGSSPPTGARGKSEGSPPHLERRVLIVEGKHDDTDDERAHLLLGNAERITSMERENTSNLGAWLARNKSFRGSAIFSQASDLDDAILLPTSSMYQESGGKELFVSRFSCTPVKSVVSDFSDYRKKLPPFLWRIGAPRTETDIEQEAYGQWLSTSNRNFDSLDFQDVESLVLHEAKAEKGGDVEAKWWLRWCIVVISAALIGVLGFAINYGITKLMELKFHYTEMFMSTPSQDFYSNSTDPRAKETAMPMAAPFFVFAGFQFLYVAVAAALVIWGEPVAKGSGIGEIKCFLNGIRLSRVLRFKTLCCKSIGVMFSVASGLPCGIPGPMVHCGACIAGGLSQGKSSKLHFDTGFLRQFRTDKHRRDFATAGAAAGIGVAFAAPIGGVLFAVEAIGSFWSFELTLLVVVCSTVAPWVMQMCLSPSTLTGSVRGLINFGEVTGSYHYYDLPFVALLGLLGGALGTAFIKLNIMLARVRQRFITTPLRKFFEAVFVNFMVSLILMVLVLFLSSCLPLPDSSLYTGKEIPINFKNYGCNKGEYNDLATYYLRSMTDTVHVLIHSNQVVGYETLLKHFLPYFILTLMTYGIHVPLGIFLPAIALGATLGHMYADLWNLALPSDEFQLERSVYAVFGAAAVLGGFVQMTISIVVIIMEATANTTFFYPLALVVLCAKLVGSKVTHGSIYDVYVRYNHIPFLPTNLARPEMHIICAGDIMSSDLVLIPETLSVGHLVFVLKSHPFHNALLVVNDDGKLRGFILRRTALVLIEKRAWEEELKQQDFAKSAQEREYLKLRKYKFFERHVPEDADSKLVTLTRYMDQWPITFPPNTPLSRVYSTFRGIGLRHIFITDDENRPLGMVTRKQLAFLEMCDPIDLQSMPQHTGVDAGGGGSGGSGGGSGGLSYYSPGRKTRRPSTGLHKTGSGFFGDIAIVHDEDVEDSEWRDLQEWTDSYRKNVN